MTRPWRLRRRARRSLHNARERCRGYHRSSSARQFWSSSRHPDNQEKLIYQRKKRESAAVVVFHVQSTRGRLHVAEELLHFIERVAIEGVVIPAALAPVGNEPGVLQHIYMEGE